MHAKIMVRPQIAWSDALRACIPKCMQIVHTLDPRGYIYIYIKGSINLRLTAIENMTWVYTYIINYNYIQQVYHGTMVYPRSNGASPEAPGCCHVARPIQCLPLSPLWVRGARGEELPLSLAQGFAVPGRLDLGSKMVQGCPRYVKTKLIRILVDLVIRKKNKLRTIMCGHYLYFYITLSYNFIVRGHFFWFIYFMGEMVEMVTVKWLHCYSFFRGWCWDGYPIVILGQLRSQRFQS